ncbi:MAG: GNAT family N-acetyltransferase, partial [Turicibacter sp.]
MENIRAFETKDLDKVMSIWKESTILSHQFISKDYWESNYDVVKNVYLPMADTFVYEDDETIKGFISIINNEFIG